MQDSHPAEQILRMLLAGILLPQVLCGCKPSAAEPTKEPAPAIAVQLTHPQRGRITRSIVLPGEVKPYQQATLYAKVGGYLKTIRVDKGDSVEQGEVIAEIEVPELLADLAKYKAELEVAELDY